MDNLHTRFSWKVWVVILIVIGVILLVFIFSSFLFTSPTKTISKNQNQEVSPVLENKSISPTSALKNAKEFSDKGVKVSYPPNWQVNSGSDKEGSAVIIQPLESSGSFPRVDVLIYPKSSGKTKTSVGLILSSIGFKKSSTTFLNRPADKYEFLMDGKRFVTGNPQKKDVKKEVYILETNQNIYEIDFAYYVDAAADQTSKLLQEIIKTIKIE